MRADLQRLKRDTESGQAGAAESTARSRRVSQAGAVATVGGLVLLLGGLFFLIPTDEAFGNQYQSTESGGTAGEVVKGLPPLSKGKYVAVLPFHVLGDAQSIGYVGEGLREALSARLFQLKEVHVASSGDTGKMDTKAPLPQIAKHLGANLIVSGVVQGSADQLRITVKLDNVAENKVLWNQEFSGVPGDLLTIEDKICGKLAEVLEANSLLRRYCRRNGPSNGQRGCIRLVSAGPQCVARTIECQKHSVGHRQLQRRTAQGPEVCAGIYRAGRRQFADVRQ